MIPDPQGRIISVMAVTHQKAWRQKELKQYLFQVLKEEWSAQNPIASQNILQE